MSEPFRIQPRLPAAAMKTYSIVAPAATHFRQASCAEVDCPHYLNGWQSVIDERTELGQFQADYIRKSSRRGFSEQQLEDGRTLFSFHPGQTCFSAADHKLRLEREELFVIRDGDHRGNPRGTPARLLPSAQAWVDDFGEHQEVLVDRMKEG